MLLANDQSILSTVLGVIVGTAGHAMLTMGVFAALTAQSFRAGLFFFAACFIVHTLYNSMGTFTHVAIIGGGVTIVNPQVSAIAWVLRVSLMVSLGWALMRWGGLTMFSKVAEHDLHR